MRRLLVALVAAVALLVPQPVDAAPGRVAPPASSPVWGRLAQCESGGRWNLQGRRYSGGLQFSPGSWRAVGGRGFAWQASRVEQIERARRLFALQGWRAWPGCSRRLGLRR